MFTPKYEALRGIGSWLIVDRNKVINDPKTGIPMSFGSLKSAVNWIIA